MAMLIDIDDFKKEQIYEIWDYAFDGVVKKIEKNVAWSFEGNGIRTRTTFVQAFQQLGLSYVELPNFLKTNESIEDLAGYMDPFYDLYVIREKDHLRMIDFARATSKPVINAMSCNAHPCEVLTDAHYLHSKYGSLQSLKILLWGPVTNVFKSWHSLAKVLDVDVTHYCPEIYRKKNDGITYCDQLIGKYDVVITDAWSDDFSDDDYSLSEKKLCEIGLPELLPTPPVSIGRELLFKPSSYDNFSGYIQKKGLLKMQKSIITYLL